jgi:hypothetical protein
MFNKHLSELKKTDYFDKKSMKKILYKTLNIYNL